MLRFLFYLWSFLFALKVQPILAASNYQEQLNLQPLPSGALRASFDFRSNESLTSFENQNFRFFPRSLGQILQHASTKELHLRFSTGRWNAELWGGRPWHGTREGGTGVELWAWIEADSDKESFEKWTTLTQSLSGLFCASLNFIDDTRTTRPIRTFDPEGDHAASRGHLRLLHGVLPGEVVCTENLTPFLKLLPCKGKAGIASLLDGHKVFDASWQSMSIDTRPVCPAGSESCYVEMSQMIDMVLDIERAKRPRDNPIPRPVPVEQLVCDESKPYHSHDTCYPKLASEGTGWSLHEIFGRKIPGACPLIDEDWKPLCLHVPHERKVYVPFGAFEVKSPAGELPEFRCYHFRAEEEFTLEAAAQQLSAETRLPHERVRAERTIVGRGAAKGGIRTILTNPSTLEPVQLVYFETLPWFMRPFVHTLKAVVITTATTNNISSSSSSNQHPAFPNWEIVKEMFYRPAIDRKRGTQLELLLSIPPASTVTLTYDFEKAILRYTEYPPDANRGFNVAPAVIKVLANGAHRDNGNKETKIQGIVSSAGDGVVYLRTTSLLLPLPTPDFSMPYNVIILTSTVMALAFGSIFNLLVRRFVGADEVAGYDFSGLRGRVLGGLVAVRDRVSGKARKTE
jgi:GPI-anchor transamidase subunit T